MTATDIKTPEGWIQHSLSMEGNERAIINAIVAAHNDNPDGLFVYLEIGIYQGGTIMAACRVIEQLERPATVIGLDIKDWGAKDILQPWFKDGANPRVLLPIGSREVLPDFLDTVADNKLNVAVIDACHCHDCTVADFLAVEPFMVSGSRVIFHDSSPLCQGSPTANCEESDGKIRVREALTTLDLLPCGRGGWLLETDMVDVPHGVTVFKRL